MKRIYSMHVDARLPANLSQIYRLSVHVWPYINSAYPPLSRSCCGPISLAIAAALLEVAKQPCEPASLLSVPFPPIFHIILSTQVWSALSHSISPWAFIEENLFVGTKDSIHPLGWVAGYGRLRSECEPVDRWGLGREGCQKDNNPENRWDYMAQPIKLPSKQVGKQPTSQTIL